MAPLTEAEAKLLLKQWKKQGFQVSEYMGLSEIKNRQWAIFKCSAKKGEGVQESMEWLANALTGQKQVKKNAKQL